MNIFSGLEEIVKSDIPLSKHTWYGLGGPADYFITPKTVDQLKTVVERCNENGLKIYVLGQGSNVLVRDEGVRGAVVRLSGSDFEKIEFSDGRVTTGAGADLNKLVLSCVRKELSGLEALTGVPGTVGGAVRMNAGGNFGDIGSSVESVTLMDKTGGIFEKSKPELVFDYRQSNITARFILNATINVAEADSEQLLRTIKEVWMYKKNRQPLSAKSAGCVFKNPRGVSAGALIDRAGLKGLQSGGAQVSDKHGNFIIAHKDCSSSDILNLINSLRIRIKESFDIDLELELEIW